MSSTPAAIVSVLVCQSQPEPVKINGKVQRGLLLGLEDFTRVVEVIMRNATATYKASDREDLTGEHRQG